MSFWYWIVAALFAVGLWFYWRAGGWKSCDIPPYPTNRREGKPGSQAKGSPNAEHESKSQSDHGHDASRR